MTQPIKDQETELKVFISSRESTFGEYRGYLVKEKIEQQLEQWET